MLIQDNNKNSYSVLQFVYMVLPNNEKENTNIIE